MNKISATVVADSINPQGDRLTSLLITFPRILLSEINTHRMLSKNTSSSRAIPFNKMVEAVQNDPFIPIAWQKEHKGMQGNEYITDNHLIESAELCWLSARDEAVLNAKLLNGSEVGVTKQLCNRFLEPFMWTTMLITGPVKGGWDNFFNLRCPQYTTPVSGKGFIAKSWKELISWHSNETNLELLENATELFKLQHNKGQGEIHIMKMAEMIYDALQESKPTFKKAGEWHIPYFNDYTLPGVFYDVDVEKLVKISTSKAARESYTIVGNEVNVPFEKHIELYEKLVAYEPPHSSPLEHTAQVPTQYEYDIALKGEEEGWFYNLKGFKSYRYILENTKF